MKTLKNPRNRANNRKIGIFFTENCLNRIKKATKRLSNSNSVKNYQKSSKSEKN